MPETVFGLPVHPLVIHATVVFVPAAALLLLLSALWPRFRSWSGLLTPVVALIALALVPITTSSGEDLRGQLGDSALIEHHAELADMMLPWMIAVTVLAAGVWWVHRRPRPSRTLVLTLAALSVVAAVGTTVQVVLVGHSGADAAWHGVGAQMASNGGSSSTGDGDEG